MCWRCRKSCGWLHGTALLKSTASESMQHIFSIRFKNSEHTHILSFSISLSLSLPLSLFFIVCSVFVWRCSQQKWCVKTCRTNASEINLLVTLRQCGAHTRHVRWDVGNNFTAFPLCIEHSWACGYTHTRTRQEFHTLSYPINNISFLCMPGNSSFNFSLKLYDNQVLKLLSYA